MPESLFYKIIVKSGGAEYDLSTDISSINWEQSDERPDRVTLQIPDPYKVFGHALREGTHVEFTFGTDAVHDIVFRGRIYSVAAKIAGSGLQALTVNAEDRSAELGLKKYPGRSYADELLSTIVKKILEPYKFADVHTKFGLDPKVTLVQQDETDLAFLQRTAQNHGCTMFVSQTPDGEEISFVGLAKLVALEPKFVFSHGRFGVDSSLIEFQGQVDARRAQNRVILMGLEEKSEPIDPKAVDEPVDPFRDENFAAFEDKIKLERLKILINDASAAGEMTMLKAGEGGAQDEVIYVNVGSKDQLALLRENWISVNAYGMTADGTCAGLPGLRARATITLNDVGGRFSGKWYVSQVVHSIGAEGFDTRFYCKR